MVEDLFFLFPDLSEVFDTINREVSIFLMLSYSLTQFPVDLHTLTHAFW